MMIFKVRALTKKRHARSWIRFFCYQKTCQKIIEKRRFRAKNRSKTTAACIINEKHFW